MPLVLDGDTGIVGVLLTDANGNVTFDTNTLYVDAPNNRVGIGTTVPDGKLTVALENSNTPAFRLSSPTSGTDFAISSYNDANGTYVSIGVNHLFNVSGNDAVMDTNDKSAAIVLDGRNNGRIQFLTNSSGIATPRMNILQDGNVGIGSTSPESQLTISRSNSALYSTLRFTNSGASGRQYEIGIGGSTSAAGFANNLYFYDSTASSNRMVIASSGYVGIGQSNPDARLDLGTLNSSTAGSNQMFQLGAFGFRHEDTGGFNHLYLERNYGGWQTTPQMTFKANGNVGIGVTSPNNKLEVDGTIAFSKNGTSGNRWLLIEGADGTYAGTMNIQAGFGSNAAGGAIKLYAHQHATYPGSTWIGRSAGAAGNIMFGNGGTGPASANSIQMAINSSGNVGIGTDTPGEKLHVYGSGGQFIKLETTTTGSAAFVGLRMQDGDGDLGSIGDFGSGRRAFMLDTGSGVDMMFFTDNQNNSSNTPRMTISSSGKIGINTLPLADTTGTLHVGGGLSVGSGNHAGYHVFSQHEGNVPSNTTREVLQFEGPAYARYMTVTISGYLCRKEQYFSGYQSWDGASDGNNVGSTVIVTVIYRA